MGATRGSEGARLVLASGSPRRRQLLEEAGLSFAVAATDVDETIALDTPPLAAARELAERKVRAALERVVAGAGGEGIWLLAADTVVAVPDGDGTLLLGKPDGPAEARAFLDRLSGSRHEVVTGVAVARAGGSPRVDAERTVVTMRELSVDERDAYVASGEWQGKAGGYAIQETADAFVLGLEEGGFDNVVGLPVERCLGLLEECGALLP